MDFRDKIKPQIPKEVIEEFKQLTSTKNEILPKVEPPQQSVSLQERVAALEEVIFDILGGAAE